MTPRPPKPLLTILVDDQGAWVRDQEGQLVGRLPDAKPGAERRAAWASALREAAPKGTQVQILFGHSNLMVQCQEVPFLSHKEVLDVASRLTSSANVTLPHQTSGVLDPDPSVPAGHILWVAGLPRPEMNDWSDAIEAAGLSFAFALPAQRAMLCGMEDVPELPADRLVLTLERGYQGHLYVFHGRSLALARAFSVPEDEEAADEVVFEEVSRLLQFYKQKNRNISFANLYLLGVRHLSPALQNRIQGTLRLSTALITTDLWPLLLKGLAIERHRKNGLNLVPIEIQEAVQRRLLNGMVWGAAALMILLFLAGGGMLYLQQRDMRLAADQAEAALAQREARSADEERIVQARLPLLQVKLAEQRQVEATRTVAHLAKVLLQAPTGIQLEKVEISQIAGDKMAHQFRVSGLSFTNTSFSVGPLARFAEDISREDGVKLAPITQVSVSDRLDEASGRVDQKAITRFTLEGTAP
jgi:hypothetical protein